MPNIQKCPLCNCESTFSHSTLHENTVKNVKCPRCKKLVFEEGTEEKICAFLQQTRDRAISMGENMSDSQVLYFSWDHTKKNKFGESSIDIRPIDPNCL